MDIYSHELSSYKLEIENIKDELNDFGTGSSLVNNVTHFGLGISNRGHLITIGLCSLVEIYLYDLAKKEEMCQLFKFSDISGQGITKLQSYLSKTKKIDFGTLSSWSTFKDIYSIRNSFVHSYGGLMESPQLEKAKSRLDKLGMNSSLVANHRLRLTHENLEVIYTHIDSLISELKDQT